MTDAYLDDSPRVGLRDGLRRTIDFHPEHMAEYVESSNVEAQARR